MNSATSETLEGTQRATDLAAELNAAIAEVAESITRGDQLARDTVHLASSSRQTVEELNEATQQISDFVRVITELAEQTNLLALNATIESARAGEHGKGFAVVASEIKQLASQTNTSATHITDRVQQIQARTQTAVKAISQITESIESLGGVTSSVAAAVEEQRVSTDSFTNFLETNRIAIEDVASKVSALASVTRNSSESTSLISSQVDEMARKSQEASEAIPKIVQKAVAAADNRGAPRTPIRQPVKVTADGQVGTTLIKDLSTSVARLARPASGHVEVDLPDNLGTVGADTVWSNDHEAGVKFEKPIETSLMQRLLNLHKSDAA